MATETAGQPAVCPMCRIEQGQDGPPPVAWDTATHSNYPPALTEEELADAKLRERQNDDTRAYWPLEDILRVAAEEGISLDFRRVSLSGMQGTGISRAAVVGMLRMLAAIPDDA